MYNIYTYRKRVVAVSVLQYAPVSDALLYRGAKN